MKNTDFSRHAVSELREWKKNNKIELQPDFQRGAVWPRQAQSMLIDSLFKQIPVPKIYVSTIIKNGDIYRKVIDGQQRITAILDFLADKFSLAKPYEGPHLGKKFSELDEDVQNSILQYRLDFNEFEDYSDKEIREIYNRVNKYTVSLNKQELRRADFPGDFLKLSESLSVLDFFDDARIFTPANRRRMGDVEYVSELLAIIIDGIQDKKNSLDDFYINYAQWPSQQKKNVHDLFNSTLDDIATIFLGWVPIHKTRFKQKSDFYSLFSAILAQKKLGRKLHQNLLHYTYRDLNNLDSTINPDAMGPYGEYAIRCVSDANSRNSRIWRTNFLSNFLVGLYDPNNEDQERLKFFVKLLNADDSGYCQGFSDSCCYCEVNIEEGEKDSVYAFPKGEVFFEALRLLHRNCINDENRKSWVIYEE
ncbi:MAG: DUF262 domain-containing protein [Aliivibrio sp.]|uniref:DUF262 domain-containing protein n=1 Tax=Aliivibrio sp. TaxID=1872443 RepID=UPI001A3C1D8A|nr:DUF262 domain-containing protein [Aliivibrio sp.]